jgi:hypothetical protein
MLAPVLREIGFAQPNGELVPGLIHVGEKETGSNRVDEVLALREARSIKDVDYVYFRRFTDQRSSQVVAYVVDNSNQRLDESALAQLHKRVWLHGGVPLIYVAWPTRIDILTCARGPDFWVAPRYEYKPAEEISFALTAAAEIEDALAEKRARYSAWRLADGTFWEDPHNAWLAKSERRAHESLIQAVVETDIALEGEQKPLMRRLLLLMVLIKYLEDRQVFPGDWFGQFVVGAQSFLDVLRNGSPEQCLRLLKMLAERFHGDIFSLPEKSSVELTPEVLRAFANLVEARTIKQQRYLWEQFSFEHIPVETVSHLYQRFVKGGHGTVYTPPFMASLLLDHAMPFEKIRGDERILDPACGSGVFLVGAFRRLVSVWRNNNGWAAPDVTALKEVLHQSIFGIELDSNAIDLAGFSLALAVCDSLKPDVIWSDLTFDSLKNRNLVEGDFFAAVKQNTSGAAGICNGGFDIIIGNPPFESDLTTPGHELNNELATQRGDLPDQQAAYLFLEQGMTLVRPGGRLCLVQPSGILYNRKAAQFRNRFFKNAAVNYILDFTSIRNLFGAADPKTLAILATKQTPEATHEIFHLTFRRSFGTKQKLAFELDHYDWHTVPQSVAVTDIFTWRLNLLGGGRLRALSQRIRDLSTLKSYTEAEQLDFGEGYIVGNRANEATYLTGMRYLPATALTENGVKLLKLGAVTETHFEGPRPETRYQPPLILFRKIETLPMDYWNEGPLAFTSTIVAIGQGKSTTVDLEELYGTFREHHRTYRLCAVLHGSKAFVAKATAILKQDIDELPSPREITRFDLSYWESVIRDDVLDYMCDYIRLGQESKLLKNQAVIKDVGEYARLFVQMLKTIYGNLTVQMPIFLDGLICQPFCFGELSNERLAKVLNEQLLRRLVYSEQHASIRTVRVVRLYAESVLLVIKPDRLRYWIRSTAIQDADDTLSDLTRQGY